MKKPFIWALALVTLCAVFTLTAPKSQAADIQADGSKDLREFLKSANNGDTIILNAGCFVNDETSRDAPWVIDKAVTFRGGDITVRMGGIILNADVTFQGTRFTFTSYVRHGIMANGHTLTLDGVTCTNGGRPIHLFCGGFYTGTGGDYESTPGSGGQIIIRGKTSLASSEGVGNIYAGNLCLGGMTADVSSVHGPVNTFAGNPEIVIEAEQGSELGRIYAGGAEEKIPERAENGKVFLTNSQAYKVSGSVRVQLHAATVTYVDGLGAAETHVTYTDTRTSKNVTDNLGVYCISGLTVKSGHVSPKADSSFLEGASLAVNSGAKLGLEQMGNVTVGSFAGGGKLILGEEQTLTVSGNVTGETLAAVGGFNFGETESSGTPASGHVYIKTPSFQTGLFMLAPPSNQPGMVLSRDENGNWFVENRTVDNTVRVSSVRFDSETVFIGSGDLFLDGLPLFASYVDKWASLNTMNIQISVNDVPARITTYTDIYGEECENYECATELGTVYLAVVSGDVSDEALAITAKPYDLVTAGDALPDGVYRIEITVPGSNTASGQPITASTTLKVGGDGMIGGISPGAGTPNTVRVLLAAPSGPVKAGTVMAAVYDEKGRLVSFGEVPFPEDFPEGEGVSVDVPVTLSGGKTVKVFAADERKPLCPSQGISI